ncbi:hypothetical protein CB0940_05596 [Cercospora beticola]|uniref:Uncharacterized protein n=1 Tax=Cercospora beticola TaxID=122368 RepID=A0A2G5HXU7_CERBT|nr:hypothetical protein CB0940_05596 [Cercospora beticola]PIA97062.1 hypothetical protein CB0940_05596 [Cercospora beticola]WPA98159.1 hypothetical protein RHO25_002770 [Cercospora beticola]CAK1359379.1 unnamed protein product [Cercospora beticola]
MVSSRLALLFATTLLASNVAAQETSSTSSAAPSASTGVPTEVTSCHSHADGYYCFEGETEWKVTTEIANEDDAPEEYTACTAGANSDTIQCNDASGAQLTLAREGSEAAEEDHDHDHSGEDHDHDHAEESASESAPSGSASATTTPSASGAAAETTPSETTAGNAGNAVIPAAGMSLAALFAYLLV